MLIISPLCVHNSDLNCRCVEVSLGPSPEHGERGWSAVACFCSHGNDACPRMKMLRRSSVDDYLGVDGSLLGEIDDPGLVLLTGAPDPGFVKTRRAFEA